MVQGTAVFWSYSVKFLLIILQAAVIIGTFEYNCPSAMSASFLLCGAF